MSVLRLSRVAFGPVLIVLAVILVLLFVSVRLAGALGAVPGPPDKKGEEPKNKLDNPLDVKGKLEDNDPNDPARNQPAKTYTVKLKKDKTYIIDMSSVDFDAYLRLEDDKGKQLAEDDDSGGGETGLDAQITFTPDADGSFKIFATRFADGTGNFTLKVRELSYKSGKVLTVEKGELKIEAKITNDDPVDQVFPKTRYKIYSVKMVAGRAYTIDLVTNDADFDPWLRLTDARFRKLAEDDDSGGDLNSRIEFTPKADGVYHIIATNLNPDAQTGTITLTVREQK